MSFQDLIDSLNRFWAKQGCLVGQPYGVEVGAGTGNPNTFFRVLGPEPYNVAYVEPSRRPTDGRYGQSPNRFQHYFQYQVILKPAPKFNQELFIESLVAIGLDPTKHDIRFVEDNWESTPLGAWGLGWEIWCDGMEIAQYTYFQQMAGTPLEVPALEITYGLERLAMYIQNIDHYKDLKWNSTTTYADLFERHEFWQAKHNFETSTPEALKNLFAIYEKEVQTQLEQKNYWAAYDYLLKVSHVFNLLDARGMISLSDRVAKFTMMGRATKAISTLYLEEREALGYPLKNRMAPVTYKPKEIVKLEAGSKSKKYQKNIAIVELGFEEIPASYLIEWKEIISHAWFRKLLKQKGMTYRKAYLYLSPRRIVMKIVQPSKLGKVVELIKGPTAQVAYDEAGKPTQVLEGFLRKYELVSKDVHREAIGGKEIVVARKTVTKPLNLVLQEIGQEIIDSAPKTKWMVWEQNVPAFIRPLRSIIAFHNDRKLPISLMNITSDRFTPLPRYELPAVQKIGSAQEYLNFLQLNGIILSQKKRAKRIEHESLKKDTHKVGKFDDMVLKNSFLTENPHALAIALDKQYKILPRELILLILEKNQMYPIIEDKEKNLWYNVIANHKRVHKRIELGNQKVARARLEDGLFYFQMDGQKKLADYSEGLKLVGFHPKAGSYYEKKQRIAELTHKIYEKLGKRVPGVVVEALKLIKNDKATALGKEFPSLEGVIGRVYALRDGVNKDVAELLSEHYLPIEPGGELPKTQEAMVLSVADKLDTLVTLSAVEKLPEGSHDPFEIRKTVYRLLTLLTRGNFPLSLDDIPENLYQFIEKRFEQMLEQEGIAHWIASGVADSRSKDFAQKYAYAKALDRATTNPKEQEIILDTLKRIKNILTQAKETGKDVNIQAHAALEPTEKELLTFVINHRKQGIKPQELPQLAHLLERFFKEVMVMDPDMDKRNRRIAILRTLQHTLETDFALSFT